MRLTLIVLLLFACTPSYATSRPTDGMDRTAKPGDDFYAYANGAWERSATIPAGRAYVFGTESLRVAANANLASIVADAAADPASRAGALYRSYENRAVVDARGVTPALPYVNEIRGLDTKTALVEAMGRLTNLGVSTFLSGSIDTDDHRPGFNALHLADDGLGMERTYYVSDTPDAREVASAYGAYLQHLFDLAGLPRPTELARDVTAFERRLALSYDPDGTQPVYDPLTVRELDATIPGVAWEGLVHAMGWPADRPILIDSRRALAARTTVFRESSVSTVRAYLLARFLDTYARWLSDDVANTWSGFHDEVLRGVSAPSDRASLGMALVRAYVPDEIDARYVARYFPPAARAGAQAMAERIKTAFATRIRHVTWMDDDTRHKALEKLDHVHIRVGYPDVWETYAGLSFDDRDLFGNVLRAETWSHRQAIAALDKAFDMRKWTCVLPSTVNACSDPGTLSIYFPAAVLQAPNFDPLADAASNYGHIGTTIGHELSHQFDPSGSRFDATGRRIPWWPDAVRERYDALTGRLARQYDRYEAAPAMFVDGKRTLEENVADLVGLEVAYDAYRQSLDRPLPIVDGLTGDQRFFLAYAQNERGRYTAAGLRNALATNVHAPGAFRTLEVRNVDAWYEAFGVTPNDRLYLAPQDRVRIW